MGQATNQIEAHIADTRAELGANLQELEHKVKKATDWKHHFRANPFTIMGFAFGTGMLLAAILPNHRNGRAQRKFKSASSYGKPSEMTLTSNTAREAMDTIKSALVGVAAARATDWIGNYIPGFHEQFQRSQAKAGTFRSS
jgi:hypothetical protein